MIQPWLNSQIVVKSEGACIHKGGAVVGNALTYLCCGILESFQDYLIELDMG